MLYKEVNKAQVLVAAAVKLISLNAAAGFLLKLVLTLIDFTLPHWHSVNVVLWLSGSAIIKQTTELNANEIYN